MIVLSSNATSSPVGAYRTGEEPGFGDALRSTLALLWIEIRRSQGFWLLPLMVGLGLYLNWGRDYEGVVLWPNLSTWTMRSYVIVGPLAAALAAWLVDRDRRRRVQGLVETMATNPFRRDIVLSATASFWGLAGYGLIAAWYGVQGAREATWGGPDMALIATGALGVVILTGFGFIVGRLVRGKFSPIIAVAATFFLSAAPEFIQTWTNPSSGMQTRLPFRPLTPWGLVADGEPSVYSRFPAGYLDAGLIWLTAVAAITIVAIALMRGWRRNWIAWIALLVSGAVALLGADRVMGYDEGSGSSEDLMVPFTWSCTTTTAAEVCVHPAYESKLEESARRINDFLLPVAGLPGLPTRWEQSSPVGERGTDVATFYPGQQYSFAFEIGHAIFPYTEDPHGFTAAQSVILTWLSGRVESGRQASGMFSYPAELMQTPVTDDNGQMVNITVDPEAQAYYAREIRAATDRFAALGPEAQQAWLKANWDALRAGELTLEDLP